MKIVLTDCKTIAKGDIDIDSLKEFGELIKYETTSDGQIAERIKDADAVLCNKTVLNRENMKNAKNLKYIGLWATGYNNIDIEYCRENSITVCNAGDYSTDAVAQHTFALILYHFGNVHKYAQFVENGGWKSSEVFSPFVFPTDELAGKALGIVGFGSIGMAVAKIALAFGMKVFAYNRNKKNYPGVTFTDLDTLLASSDIVSVHCPLNEDSYKLFGEKTFSKFKDGAYFVNTARGAIVDEPALAQAVKSGKLSGAAIDVLTEEPMAEHCALYGVENIVITPHIAWAPLSTRTRLLEIVKDNIRAFLNGNPKNVV